MKFFSLVLAAIVPMTVLATPTPATPATPASLALSLEERAPTLPKHALLPRQSGISIGDLIGQLLPGLQAIGQLVQPGTINNIKVVVDGLATVLGEDRAQNTANLLDTVGGLLSGDLLDQLQGLLPAVGGLLTEDNINKISGLLNNASNLLTEQFVSQTSGLINDVAPLVSAISQIIVTLLQALLGGGGS